jgi:flagellar hook assembly protein FlgD
MAAEDNTIAVPVNALGQNYPNPFQSLTGIDFTLKDSSQPAKLTIYNLKGQVVKVLLDGKSKSVNNHLEWDGKDYAGNRAANGIYYYKLSTAGFVRSRKMVLLK